MEVGKMKKIEELREGDCQVVTKQGKIFHGYFSEKYPCVFFAIPSTYEIIGYIQD